MTIQTVFTLFNIKYFSLIYKISQRSIMNDTDSQLLTIAICFWYKKVELLNC